jgi:nifR3 family TIM-barrel protein
VLQIGNVTLDSSLLLAPIAGYCDLAFRLTVRPLGGVGLASTDLVNPKGLLRQTVKSMLLVETDPADRPLCIQLYGSDAGEMAVAAQWAEAHGAAVVDINMGCPVDKVCKRDGGSALLRNPDSAVQIAQHVVNAVRIPTTVKMRLGWDDDSHVAAALARRLEDIGVAAITVHGRTAAQKFAGRVNLDGIARVVEAVDTIAVIGNGDVRCPEDARAMIARTGCRGIMIGRAALSDPWIFRDTHALLATGHIPAPPTPVERVDLMALHFEHLRRIRGEHVACTSFRQRASWYTRHFGPCSAFRDRIRFLSCANEFYDLVGSLKDANMPSQRPHAVELVTSPT